VFVCCYPKTLVGYFGAIFTSTMVLFKKTDKKQQQNVMLREELVVHI